MTDELSVTIGVDSEEDEGKRAMFCNTVETKRVLEAIAKERLGQDIKWGIQTHTPEWWLAILAEEVGELAKAILEAHFGNGDYEILKAASIRAEAIQVAAVATALVECLERKGHR